MKICISDDNQQMLDWGVPPANDLHSKGSQEGGREGGSEGAREGGREGERDLLKQHTCLSEDGSTRQRNHGYLIQIDAQDESIQNMLQST